MAEIIGPLRFKGQMSGMNCYYNSLLKKWFIRKNGGPSKSQIKNSDSCARIRENDEEMKACDAWCKQLHLGLEDIDHLNAGYYMGEVVKLSKVIQKMDTVGLKGKRNVESSKYKSLLTELNFNAQHPFKQVLMRRPEVISDDERQSVIVNLTQFSPLQELVWKTQYFRYRFTLSITQLSDYVWVEAHRAYEPVHANLYDWRKTVYTDWLDRFSEAVDILLTASFKDNEIPAEDTTVLVALGIEFATELTNKTISWNKGDGTMAIIATL
jgi:hypothetical protein